MTKEDSKFHPDLLDITELELLVLLMEECGEVIQAASKCIRCRNYVHPDTGKSNIDHLKLEMNDLRVIMLETTTYMFKRVGDTSEVIEMTTEKYKKLQKWTNVFNR